MDSCGNDDSYVRSVFFITFFVKIQNILIFMKQHTSAFE